MKEVRFLRLLLIASLVINFVFAFKHFNADCKNCENCCVKVEHEHEHVEDAK